MCCIELPTTGVGITVPLSVSCHVLAHYGGLCADACGETVGSAVKCVLWDLL